MFIKGAPEVLKALVAGVGFSGMIALGFYLQERNVRLTVLNKLKFLGDLSYSLYVTHWPVVIFLTPLWALHVAGRFPGSLPLGLVVISVAPIVFAYLIHLVAEKPFTRSRKAKAAG
jgi:peptidoglycan/LPS O-acetylase OafA/YrhL